MFFYGFLFFGVVTTASVLLKALPPVPSWVYRVLCLVLACVSGLFFVPLGVLDWLLRGQQAHYDPPLRSPSRSPRQRLAQWSAAET